jgi:uncharacterized protein (TIGR00251 family)
MIEAHNKGTLLRVHVKTRSKKQAIIVTPDACDVYVKAPPFHGQANIAVIKLIAKKLNISAIRIRITFGEKNPNKILLIEDMDPQTVLTALKI